MLRNILNFLVRVKACSLAAQVMHGQGMGTETAGPTPRLWSLVVFFETYIHDGATATQADFGPKEPVELKVEK
jgi:hypothetical protein